MSNLKPCPFCGGEARITSEYDTDGFGTFHKVECRTCGASSKQHFVSRDNDCPQYYQEVRDDWNMRELINIELPNTDDFGDDENVIAYSEQVENRLIGKGIKVVQK